MNHNLSDDPRIHHRRHRYGRYGRCCRDLGVLVVVVVVGDTLRTPRPVLLDPADVSASVWPCESLSHVQ